MTSSQQVDGKRIRVDPGFDIAYPATPDTRGRARVYVKRKAYYFGTHGSPESYALFALWLTDLRRTGSAFVPSTRRDDALEFVGKAKGEKPVPRPWIAAAIMSSAVLVTGALLSSSWFFSSDSVAKVDGIEVTAQEVEHLRALRWVNEQQVANYFPSRVLEIANQLSKDGISSVPPPPPRIAAKPKVSPLD